MRKYTADFVTVRIKTSDHKRLTPMVTYDTKLHDLITKAIDALEKVSKH